jgi:hypothetical protein
MADYYMDILEISRKYLGYAAPGFVRSVFSHLGIEIEVINAINARRFADEIPKATGKFLGSEKKQQFKQDILNLLKSESNKDSST